VEELREAIKNNELDMAVRGALLVDAAMLSSGGI
jgi:hypothetical protein